jgi:hypothetical protein
MTGGGLRVTREGWGKPLVRPPPVWSESMLIAYGCRGRDAVEGATGADFE